MNPFLKLVVVSLLYTTASFAQSQVQTAKRIEQFSNDKVKVWETIIYPSKQAALGFHRHEHDRILVALTGGVLKVTNNLGKTHYVTLEKNKAYYFSKDVPNETHNDENTTNKPIKVMVVELN